MCIRDRRTAQGDLAGALESYQAGLDIAEKLAAADPGNAGWQRDLSVSHNKIGDVRTAQGDLAGALESYRASLDIREKLAADDPGNAGWQRDLLASYDRLGDMDPNSGWHAKAADLADRLAAEGRLSPADAWIPDYLREKAEQEAAQ